MEAQHEDIFRHRTVGEIVAEDYRRASVFKRFGIDFCCGGGISVELACQKKGISYENLRAELLAADRGRAAFGGPNAQSWDPSFLTLYIENVHHTYVRESLPVLVQFSQKVARVHGGEREELVEVAQLVDELALEMEHHMSKEERVLFPWIRNLHLAEKESSEAAVESSSSMRAPIEQMELEHDRAGAIISRIRVLTSDFNPPEGACATYRATFAKLEEFEEDLHMHVHMENNVLFPRALALEERVKGRVAA